MRNITDKWDNKIVCRCGYPYSRVIGYYGNKKSQYAYQCNGQLRNALRKSQGLGLRRGGRVCDMKTISAWKLEVMADSLLQYIWQDKEKILGITDELEKEYLEMEKEQRKEKLLELFPDNDSVSEQEREINLTKREVAAYCFERNFEEKTLSEIPVNLIDLLVDVITVSESCYIWKLKQLKKEEILLSVKGNINNYEINLMRQSEAFQTEWNKGTGSVRGMLS